MDKVNIRHCDINDLSTIYNIENEAFKGKGYPQFFIRQAFDILNNFFLIIENDKKEIMGYVLGAIKINTTTAWILSLAIRPKFSSQGFGKMLMKEILNIFKDYKIKTVLLTIEPNNKRALNLYLDMDFIKFKFFENYFSENEGRIVMKKKL